MWELRGGVDGPYPFGPVHIFVTEADLAEAQAVLAAVAPLDEAEEDRDETDAASRRYRHTVLVGAGVVGLLALAAAELVRLLAPRSIARPGGQIGRRTGWGQVSLRSSATWGSSRRRKHRRPLLRSKMATSRSSAQACGPARPAR